jgi:hypothetical protein
MVSFVGAYSTGRTGGARVLLAFLVAPAVSSVVSVSATIAMIMMQMPGEPPGGGLQAIALFLVTVLWGVLIFGAVAYLGTALVGFPAWLLLRWTSNESGAAYTLIGAAGGWWLAPAMGGRKWEGFPLDMIGCFAGALTLWLFWRMARREASWP